MSHPGDPSRPFLQHPPRAYLEGQDDPALEAALADLVARVNPAAHAVARAAEAARVDAGIEFVVMALDNSADLGWPSLSNVAVAASMAMQAADEAAAAAGRTDLADAVEAVRHAVDVVFTAYKAKGRAADRAVTTREGVDAAVEALQGAERILSMLVGDQARPHAGADAGASVARPPGALTSRLLGAACALLPAKDRGRYAEEWLSLLTELPTRRARAAHLLSILCGAPRHAWTLRRHLKTVPPA
ncbi:hypothetical protein [Actinomadura roseirufa]|uniref:hypothetical protein n=1 Tax=Actinomadura roseirufa TaxID=2094049 RepID=UPI001040F092|nr:hypothetical protein [Actinomadura roseirufa]